MRTNFRKSAREWFVMVERQHLEVFAGDSKRDV